MKKYMHFVLVSCAAASLMVHAMEMEPGDGFFDFSGNPDWVFVENKSYNQKPLVLDRNSFTQIMNQQERLLSKDIIDQITQYLRGKNNTINDLDADGDTFLTQALKSRHLPVVYWLLQDQWNTNVKTHSADLAILFDLLSNKNYQDLIKTHPVIKDKNSYMKTYDAYVREGIRCIELWEIAQKQEQSPSDQDINNFLLSFSQDDAFKLIPILQNTTTTSFLVKRMLAALDSHYSWNPGPKFKWRYDTRNTQNPCCNPWNIVVPLTMFLFYFYVQSTGK